MPAKPGTVPVARKASANLGEPRILMPSYRNFAKQAFRCGLYEAQDVLIEIDTVDLVCLEQGWGARVKESWLRRPLYHDFTRKLMFVNPGLQKVRLTREYDLFIAICQDYCDLPYINAISEWRERCKTGICWIDEIWAASIPGYKHWLHALSQFDYIFVGCKGSVGPLSDAIGRTCHWLPGGVDALRFCPYPKAPDRVVDVYSIGRRREEVHQALLNASAQGVFYVYDSFLASNTGVYDHRQHRDLYANMAKRSRYFVVSAAKMDDEATRGQIEVGYRYYEGAAAGTVMIGQAPDCGAFRELFDWPEAVIPMQLDGSDVVTTLNGLNSDPARTWAIRQRNTVGALSRHDWVYRWKEMFRVAGIQPLPGMARREASLRKLCEPVFESARLMHPVA